MGGGPTLSVLGVSFSTFCTKLKRREMAAQAGVEISLPVEVQFQSKLWH
jgi:ribosomal protein L11